MKPMGSDTGVRPGVVVFLVCSLAILIVFAFLWTRKAKPTTLSETEAGITREAVQPPDLTIPSPSTRPAVKDARASAVDDSGIKISGVSLGMGGAVVNVSYEVISAEKALSLAEGKTQIYLIDNASGTKIYMARPPQEGASNRASSAHSKARMMRQQGSYPPSPNRLTDGKVNSLLIPNPGGKIKSGSRVSLVVGEFQTDGLIVN